MERVWTLTDTAVTVTLVDFADPALAGEPDVRERGVRLEVRPVTWSTTGSIYSSPAMTIEPAVLRVDLLESAPGAADRMHWHPQMSDGEPGDREFDRSMVADPVGWTRELLTTLDDRVGADAAAEIRGATEEVLVEVERTLAQARLPWPDVVHDERGLAVG
ncbi:hypothetical protein [Nocardioides sp. CFH 31398]|uniref:hypothetical protein n=1 Tax=Nocardioides sp. CFH 31398 TaxID=2919579 RepID=UPI001F05156F|nr:hypothetical protein [Nocardioides sp. CFH 31398]MCH1866386.1 hypothetical protein [Nocardioides sp. CFH 31398]